MENESDELKDLFDKKNQNFRYFCLRYKLSRCNLSYDNLHGRRTTVCCYNIRRNSVWVRWNGSSL